MTEIDIARAAGRAEAYTEVLEHFECVHRLLGMGGWIQRFSNRFEQLRVEAWIKSLEHLRDNGPGESVAIDKNGNPVVAQ